MFVPEEYRTVEFARVCMRELWGLIRQELTDGSIVWYDQSYDYIPYIVGICVAATVDVLLYFSPAAKTRVCEWIAGPYTRVGIVVLCLYLLLHASEISIAWVSPGHWASAAILYWLVLLWGMNNDNKCTPAPMATE